MKKKMGFAAMNPERVREIASMGGKACPPSSRSFCNREKAVEAGKKSAAARIAKMWESKKHLLEK